MTEAWLAMLYGTLTLLTLCLAVMAFSHAIPERRNWEVGLQYSLLAGLFLSLAMSKTEFALVHPDTWHWGARVVAGAYAVLLGEIVVRKWTRWHKKG